MVLETYEVVHQRAGFFEKKKIVSKVLKMGQK